MARPISLPIMSVAHTPLILDAVLQGGSRLAVYGNGRDTFGLARAEDVRGCASARPAHGKGGWRSRVHVMGEMRSHPDGDCDFSARLERWSCSWVRREGY